MYYSIDTAGPESHFVATSLHVFTANQVLWSPTVAPVKTCVSKAGCGSKYVHSQCSQSWSSMRSMKAEKAANVTHPAHIALGPPLLASTPPAVHPAYNAL